ncbi:iron-containing redox enzyme family protein [bacterium]|nr:iron-containing redox enzyme family protein [bacterium]MBP9809280.1 iron-containing redox enzyme family protein [bacterium]
MTLATNTTKLGTDLDCKAESQIHLREVLSDSDMTLAIRNFANEHVAFNHPLFTALRANKITLASAGRLLKNYDAHASHLRRLLLKAATIMPESAVGFILENVRNEYGNGIDSDRHQLQLQDVAFSAGVSRDDYRNYSVEKSVKTFIKKVTPLYFPIAQHTDKHAPKFKKQTRALSKAAIAAGAITATELMAVEEFRALQIAFRQFDLQDHIWFDHVRVEEEHSSDSIALAHYFLSRHQSYEAVEYGLRGVLDANIDLYDGLLATITQ